MILAAVLGGTLQKEETNTDDGQQSLPVAGISQRLSQAGIVSLALRSASNKKDTFLTTLGAKDEEDVYYALQNGQPLSDIAIANQADPEAIIDVQIAQMNQILRERYESGSISAEVFMKQKAEIPALITASVHGQANV